MDTKGYMFLLEAKKKLQMNKVWSAMKTALAPLLEEHRKSVFLSLHPLDELDATRIAAGGTIESLRPKGRKPESLLCLHEGLLLPKDPPLFRKIKKIKRWMAKCINRLQVRLLIYLNCGK